MEASNGSVDFSEIEAAQRLGIKVEQLRNLLRRHFPEVSEETAGTRRFRRSDLVLLRYLRSVAADRALEAVTAATL